VTRLALTALTFAALSAAILPKTSADEPPTAHSPQFENRTLWPKLTGKEYFLETDWPKGRLMVWAHPGRDGRYGGRNSLDPTDPGMDGTLRLIVNDTLAGRQPKQYPTYHEKKLLQTRIVTVAVKGMRGVLGADVRLADAKARTVARRVIGSQVLTGCRGPDTVDLAVREPGPYVLSVRFSDGTLRQWNVDLNEAKRVSIEATIGN